VVCVWLSVCVCELCVCQCAVDIVHAVPRLALTLKSKDWNKVGLGCVRGMGLHIHVSVHFSKILYCCCFRRMTT